MDAAANDFSLFEKFFSATPEPEQSNNKGRRQSSKKEPRKRALDMSSSESDEPDGDDDGEDEKIVRKRIAREGLVTKKSSMGNRDCEFVEELCTHSNRLVESGVEICTDCGEEIDSNLFFDKEWRYYGASDSRHTSDPNRCQARKIEEKSIHKDVEGMGFGDSIISIANKIYLEVTEVTDEDSQRIFRGNSRKSIVFACIFHAYKLNGTPQSLESLIPMFDITKKAALRGLRFVNRNAPKHSPVRTTYITPANLVEEIMDKFSASRDQKNEVIELYKKINNKSSRLNCSRPQSVASGLTYYWICKKNKNISIREFVKKVGLSELTVNRISKEISEILEKEKEKEK